MQCISRMCKQTVVFWQALVAKQNVELASPRFEDLNATNATVTQKFPHWEYRCDTQTSILGVLLQTICICNNTCMWQFGGHIGAAFVE